jgi:hypothetical protein
VTHGVAVADPADASAAAPRRPVRMRWGATLSAAFVVTLVRPVSWLLGLLGFLAGGGLFVVAAPIVVLPTPTGIQNALGGPVSTLVFDAPSTGLVLLIAGVAAAGLLMIVLGTLLGAWAERQLIEVALDAAADEGLLVPRPDLTGAPGAAPVAVIRLLALVPVVLALAIGWRQLYDAAYRELILPDDLATPLPVRILGDVPWLLIGIAAAWLASDAAAALGVRRLVLERRPVLVAWLLGWADLVRRPHRVLGTALVGVGVMALLLALPLLAVQVGWERVQLVVLEGSDPLLTLGSVLTWVAIWLGMLVLAGVAAAFRSAAFTFELPRTAGPRHRPPAPRV